MDDTKVAISNILKAAKDMKVIGIIVLIVVILYMGGYETVWVNSWKEINKVSSSIDQQKGVLEDKKATQQQYEKWESELKELDNTLIEVDETSSVQSASVKHSRQVEALALGGESSTLPEPHNKRTVISNKLEQYTTYKIPENAPGMEIQGKSTEIEFSRFDYTITLTGTYVGLLDFVNHLALLNPLVTITKIQISPIEGQSPERPDPEEHPDFPLNLRMELKYSIFLQNT